jgi:hypothetical protein
MANVNRRQQSRILKGEPMSKLKTGNELTTKTAGELELERLEREINTEAFEAFCKRTPEPCRVSVPAIRERAADPSTRIFQKSGGCMTRIGRPRSHE